MPRACTVITRHVRDNPRPGDVSAYIVGDPRSVEYPPRFTTAQIDTLREVATGKTTIQVAQALGEPARAVRKRIARMLRLAWVPSRTALVVWALQEGVLNLDKIDVQLRRTTEG